MRNRNVFAFVNKIFTSESKQMQQESLESQLFFVDKQGDETLFSVAARLNPSASRSPDDFIRLPSQKEFKKHYKKNRKSLSSTATKGHKPSRKEIQDEEFAVMLDYIQNCQGDTTFTGKISALASLNLSDASDSDHVNVENGVFDALMEDDDDYSFDTDDMEHVPKYRLSGSDSMGSDEDVSFDGEYDSDDSNEAEFLRREYKMSHSDDSSESNIPKSVSKTPKGKKKQVEFSSDSYSDSDMDAIPVPKTPQSIMTRSKTPKNKTISFDSGSGEWSPVTTQLASKSARRKAEKKCKRDRRSQLRQNENNRMDSASKLAKHLKQPASKASKGINAFLESTNMQIKKFVAQNNGESTVLPPMPGALRKLVVVLAKEYRVTPKTRGSGKHKSLILFRTGLSLIPDNWAQLPFIISKVDPDSNSKIRSSSFVKNHDVKKGKTSKQRGVSNDAAKPRTGDVVGVRAKPLGEHNMGHKMMLAMGWKAGDALGAEANGTTEPIQVMIRSKRAGLGTE